MNRRIALVVDDSRSARFAMRRLLESCGYEVQTADSGADALGQLRQRRPDVIFLDHVMPGLDGFGVLERLQQDIATATLPVVLCSSSDDGAFLDQARRRGAREVLVKPPHTEQLAAVLARLQTVAPLSPLGLSADLPVPGRVQTIRDPEVTIEHAVMKTLREALPAVAASSVADTETVAAVKAPAIKLSMSPLLPMRGEAEAAAPRLDAVRDQIESRLQQVTRELVAQIGGLRTELAQVETATNVARAHSEDRLTAVQRRQQELEARIDQLAQRFDAVLESMRSDIGAQFEVHSQRMERMAHEIHRAAIDEAHAVSERVMMNAAKRISDQIAESILNVLKPAAVAQAV